MAVVTKTIGDVVAEILMTRTAFDGSLLLLEGPHDSKFWRPRILSRDKCDIIIAGSKPTVIGATIQANATGHNSLLGVVDDDFDVARNIPLPSPNILRTDTRDIETLLLQSTALDRVLHEVGDADKIHRLEKSEGRSIRDALIARASIFGELRFLNDLHSWQVNFRDLSPYRFADIATWTFDEIKLTNEFVKSTPNLTSQQLAVHRLGIPKLNPWMLMHGKDSLCVLAVGLREIIGKQSLSDEKLSQLLRLAFDETLLKATNIYQGIKDWEIANPPYRILP